MWALTVDSALARIMLRSADSSNSGYDRLRIQATLAATDIGVPLANWTSDANSGNAALSGSTTIKRVKYRRFSKGVVITNCSIETSVPFDLSAVTDPLGVAYGTGTLGKLEVKFVAMSVPVISTRHRRRECHLLRRRRVGVR
jgi:hypothetical protein